MRKTKPRRSYCDCGQTKTPAGACPACDQRPQMIEDGTHFDNTFPANWCPELAVPRWAEPAATKLLRTFIDPYAAKKTYLKVQKVYRVCLPDDQGKSAVLFLDDAYRPQTAWVTHDDELAWVEAGW